VQVGQPVSIGVVNEHRVRVGNIESALDDRRRKQNIRLPSHEPQHDVFQLALAHLPVADVDPGFRRDLRKPVANRVNIVNSIVDEINLPAAIQLTHDRVPHQLVAESRDARLHRDPIRRRRF
jgi:hypothetical protein